MGSVKLLLGKKKTPIVYELYWGERGLKIYSSLKKINKVGAGFIRFNKRTSIKFYDKAKEILGLSHIIGTQS